MGLGRQGHVGHGRLRPVPDGGDHPRTPGSASIAAGVVLFDTAEVYGGGESERIIGRLLAADPAVRNRLVIATKFMPSPWKVNVRAALLSAARKSRERLGTDVIDLYQIHGPDLTALARRAGRGAGHGARRGHCARGRRVELLGQGDPLHRRRAAQARTSAWPATRSSSRSCGPCRSAWGSSAPAASSASCPLAYSPIGQGRLTGKYSAANPPPKGRSFSAHPMAEVDAIVALLRRIGEAHGDRTPSQVALAWLIAQGGGAHPGSQEPGAGRAERRGPGLAPHRRGTGPPRPRPRFTAPGRCSSAFGSTAETGGTVL